MKFIIKQGLVVACMMSLISLGTFAADSNQKEDALKSVALTQQDIEFVFTSTTSGSLLLTADQMRDTKGAGRYCWIDGKGDGKCVTW